MGYLFKAATWWERGLLLVAAFMLIDPGLTTDLIGLATAAVVVVSQSLRKVAPTAARRPVA